MSLPIRNPQSEIPYDGGHHRRENMPPAATVITAPAYVTVEQFKSVEQTILELANAMKMLNGTLKTVGERQEAAEKQLADATRINEEKKSLARNMPIFGVESVPGDFLFKEITASTPAPIAKAIIEKAIGSPTQDERIKEFQEKSDTIKILCGYLGKQPHELKMYKEYEAWCEKTGLGKVLSVIDSPANFIANGWSAEIATYYQQELMIATLFGAPFEMPNDPFRYDFLGTGFTSYLRGEPTTDPASKYRSSQPTQDVITLTTKELAGRMLLTRKMTEDALAAYVPKLRTELIPRGMAEGMENGLLNGDDSATHFDTVVTDADDVRKAWPGIRKIADRESATYDVQTGSTAYAYNDFGEVLLKAGKFGVKVNEGAWISSNVAYIKSTVFDEVKTAEKISLPTNINGVVNVWLGRPVIVSPQYSATLAAATGKDAGTGTTTGFAYVNHRQFMMGFRREDIIEQDRDITTGMDTIVISTRKAFQQMLPTGNTTCATGFNVPT